ncbi:MAG: hypothetical protein IPI66_07850 [Chitinophagaceae bacterium]|nr:hypothetical protein [Chitinophagaceae bacterium]
MAYREMTHLTHFKNVTLIGVALGLLSAIVDNVPLVAASQGMYDLSTYPTTILGANRQEEVLSAAGVAVMGIEQIDFMWYLKNISWLALIGFAAGILFCKISCIIPPVGSANLTAGPPSETARAHFSGLANLPTTTHLNAGPPPSLPLQRRARRRRREPNPKSLRRVKTLGPRTKVVDGAFNWQ